MPLDGYTLSFLVKELKNEITGNRIEKIHQPSKDEIIFHLRSRNGAKKLFFSVSSNYPRINLTENAPENPAVPPMFCMFMRKRLTGCVIDSIGQLGLDRTIYLDVSGTNEIGEPAGYRIWFEVMSKHSNFTITDTDGIILESLKKSDFSPNTGRQIQPGFKFILPPSQNKTNILVTDINDIVGNIKDHPNRKLSDALLSVLEGASPLISREIACSVTGNDSAVYDLTDYHYSKLEDELCKLRKELEGNGSPTLLCKDDNKPFDISFRDITQFGFSVTSKQMSGFSELTDLFFTEKTSAERSGQQGKELLKTLNNLLSRSMRKLEIRENELKECAEKDKYRIYAELILANQYSLVKGSLYYDVENFYDEYKSLRIPADPALSPAGNAQKYFKEYNKLKNAEKLLDNLIEESHTEITYLKSVIDAVERADGFTTISEIKNELYEEGYLKRNKNGKSAKMKSLPPLKYMSDDGYTILVGRNNLQNENLSLKSSARDDSWFHVQGFPGSHVVVVGNGDIIPGLTCRQAAIIAAYNSAAKNSSGVPVDYTEIRELKKPKGGKTGMVIYHKYNTMWVTPDKELCERLKVK